MSPWTHRLCDPCWHQLFPPDREPTRVKDDPLAPCCNCGVPTASGIYLRLMPGDLPCAGNHSEDED